MVTGWPNTDGLAEEASAVALLALFTVCVNVEEVLVVKLVSPPYTAVIVCEATDKEAVRKSPCLNSRFRCPKSFLRL